MNNLNPENFTGKEITVSPAWKHLKLSRFVTLVFRILLAVVSSYSAAVIFISSSSEPLNIYGYLTIAAFCLTFSILFFLIFDKFKSFLIGLLLLSGVLLGISYGIFSNVYSLFVSGGEMIAALFCNILRMFSVQIQGPAVQTSNTSMFCLFVLLSLGTALIFSLCAWKSTAITGFFVMTAAICVPLIFIRAVSVTDIAPLVCAFGGACAMKISEKHGHKDNASINGIVCFILAISILLPVGASVNTEMKKNDKFFSSLNKVVLFGQSIFTGLEDFIPSTIPIAELERSSKLTKRSLKNSLIMSILSDNSRNLYLRTWAGGAYGNDAWKPVLFSNEVNGSEASKMPERDILLGFEKLFNCALGKNSSDSVLYDIGFIKNNITVKPQAKSSVLAIPITATSLPLPGGNDDLKINEAKYDGIVLGRFESKHSYSVNILQRTTPTDKQSSLMASLVLSYMSFIDDENYTDKYIRAIKNSNMWEEACAIRREYIEYREFLYSVYCSDVDNEAIDRAVTELFESTDIQKYFVKQKVGKAERNSNGQIFIKDSKGNIAKYIFKSESTAFASEIAQIVASYLSDKCSYSLNPKSDNKLDPMEDFLFNCNQGYCVQFATAGTLIMRRLGLTARYAEGYVVQYLTNSSIGRNNFSANVFDKSAHAWSEIFVDGIGWIVCEMTPSISSLHPATSEREDTTFIPDTSEITTPPETTKKDEETTLFPDTSENTTTESETVSETEKILPVTTDEITEKLSENTGTDPDTIYIIIALFLAVSVFVTIFAYIGKKRSEKRKALLEKALNSLYTSKQKEDLEKALADELAKILRAYKLIPKIAELPSDFAKRVNDSLCCFLENELPIKAVYAVMSSVYGTGMDKNEIRAVALAIDLLNKNGRKNLGLFRYLILKITGVL